VILGLALRMTWAVASAAYRMVACAQAGHPRQTWAWDRSYRRCECGRTWPA
jgi:hypothetical protein